MASSGSGSSGWPRVTTTGRLRIAPTPRMPACGWMMIGVANRLPAVPWLVRVKVPPCTSSGVSRFVRARSARSLTARASSSRLFSLRVADHRHDQPVGDRDGHADVQAPVDQQRVFAEAAVGHGHGPEPGDDRLDEERREGQPDTLPLELAPQPLARPDDTRHVGFHDRGDVRRGLLAQHHVPGDGLAHRRERDNLVIGGGRVTRNQGLGNGKFRMRAGKRLVWHGAAA